MAVRVCGRGGFSPPGGQEIEQESQERPRAKHNLQEHTLGDLLSLAKPHLLKFLPHTKIATPSEDQTFNI
jgi:hypothetical protein